MGMKSLAIGQKTVTFFKKNKQLTFTLFLFLFFTIWWLNDSPGRSSNYFWGELENVYGLLALWGSICGITIAHKWGGFKTVIGRAIFMFSFGLLAQEFGQLAYGYYNFFLEIPVPYPSIGDIGFFGSILFYIYGVLLLAKAAGVKVKTKSFLTKIQSILIPTVILILGYLFLLQDYQFDWLNPIIIFLDFGVPLGQAIYISIAILTYFLSKGVLGGLMKNKILFVLLALLIQFTADYTFIYQASRDLWVVGGLNDYMYLTSYFLMTLAILELNRDKIISLLLPKIKAEKKSYPLQCEDIYAQLAQKIIQEEGRVIGDISWDLAFKVPGLVVDANYMLRLTGNKNEVINQLIAQYEQIFGQTSRELAKDVIKGLSTVANTLAIDAMVTLNVNSAMFFVRQASTGNFQSIFPFEAPKQNIDRHHPLIYYFLNHRELILKSAIPELIQRTQTIAEANDLKEIDLQLTKHSTGLAGGVYSDQGLLGVLMLGGRASGTFNSQDLNYVSHLLKSASGELAQIVHYRDTQAAVLRGRKSSNLGSEV